jgi:ELWxxDGT repeat protein
LELWKSDGTSNGTVLVKDIYSGVSNSWPMQLLNVNGTLYFSAADSSNGTELWRSDGTVGGTVIVKNIHSGTASSSPASLTEVDGTLYFAAIDATMGSELWKVPLGDFGL